MEDAINALREHLGSDLVAVVLYGSWARGAGRPESMGRRLARIREIIQEAGLHRMCRDGELMWFWRQQSARCWAIEREGFRESN
ncbi:MAG: nucleotidyltransferase domain-containing protein [Anaerolineae bacterium]|nr:nucleotidyltransferase domain-containing protein [Anaerolineae bacterium]